MTWVIGRAGPFGYAVGLSDVRVTLHDGTEIDCLQKIYRVGSNMALGFAGSVKIGLDIVEVLSTALHIPEENFAWDPLKVADFFPIGTREIFNKAKPEERKLGCELLLLSAHPIENDEATSWAKCYVHKFRAPDFQPIAARPAEIVTIGSGKNVTPYTDALRKLEKDFELFNLELGMMGGSAIGLMMSITSAINSTRVAGISNHLHICLIGRDGIKLGSNDITVQDHPGGNFIMPPVAQSWEEFLKVLDSRGIAKSVIEQARC